MNILRWRRKSKKKIKLKTLILFIFSLIMTTFAWFAYSKVLDPTLDLHLLAWDMVYKIGEVEQENPITISIPTLEPAMSEKTIRIDIYNNGETDVGIDYFVQSISILGQSYTLVQEGQEIPATGNYIELTQAFLETDSETGKKIKKGAITNDITRIPFTIEIEHSAEVDPKTITTTLDEVTGEEIVTETGGTGYLTIKVNWIGDNHELDSEWGYAVGEYFTTNPTATSAMSITLAVDSYQLEPIIDETTGEVTTDVTQTIVMPSTTETTPYLPTGFNRVAGTTLETGLVIKDSSGNEYVWIEVPKNNTVYSNDVLALTTVSDDDCTLIERDLKLYTETYRVRDDVYTRLAEIGLTEDAYYALKNTMLKSIYQNGGFYIGRYETGVKGEECRRSIDGSSTSHVPVIKANAYPYNYVTARQAYTLAKNMESGDNTTSLMFGIQWDLVLKYLSTKGVSIESLTTDSSDWGNYYNNIYYLTNSKSKYSTDSKGETWTASPYEKSIESLIFTTTGANTTFCKQNIFDLAGNLTEWTFNIKQDEITSKYTGGNGGNHTSDSNTSVNSISTSHVADTRYKEVGFRVTLY